MFSILVVEDDEILNKMICIKLKQEAYHVFAAFDGVEALDLLDKEHIDLIISDIMMPNMDGYQLTKELRNAAFTLPILLITAKNQMEDMEKGFHAGTDDYMIKPIHMKEMVLRVKALLRRAQVAAITGFSEILLDGGLEDQEQKEYLTYINQESLRLSRLCENMLRLSRLDHQIIVGKKQEVTVDEQLRHCIIMLGEKWSDKDINFELQLEKCSILSDPDLLFQIWTNLIDNAIKYSRQGNTVWITSKRYKDYLLVSIKDEGIGISAEKQCKIYDKFYQCEESHKKQGSGLRLSIVKRIVELLNASISCESEEGMGTTMTVMLPMFLS